MIRYSSAGTGPPRGWASYGKRASYFEPFFFLIAAVLSRSLGNIPASLGITVCHAPVWIYILWYIFIYSQVSELDLKLALLSVLTPLL